MEKEKFVKTLTQGLDTHERRDGKVIRVRAEGHPVAEVVVGTETVRVNFRERPERLPEGVHVGGNSKSWPGGGVQVTSENALRVKELLQEAVDAALAEENGSSDPIARGRGDENEVVTIPVRRRGRKMSEATIAETLDALEQAMKEGIADEVFSGDVARLLSRRLDAARERSRSREQLVPR